MAEEFVCIALSHTSTLDWHLLIVLLMVLPIVMFLAIKSDICLHRIRVFLSEYPTEPSSTPGLEDWTKYVQPLTKFSLHPLLYRMFGVVNVRERLRLL